MKQARCRAVGERLLGDQFFRQIVMKIGDQHAAAIITFEAVAALCENKFFAAKNDSFAVLTTVLLSECSAQLARVLRAISRMDFS